MLRWSHLVILLALTCATVADNVTFLRIDKTLVQQRLDQAPPTSTQRVTTLRSMFEKAGCSPQNIQTQPVPDQSLPNVICTLPGTEFGTILVAARLDYDSRGDEANVGWGGVAMLPLLAESINSTNHRHTMVFAAFSGEHKEGAAYFWKSLSDAERREYRGMVDLDHIGRTNAGFSAESNSAVMARMLPAASRALQYKPEPQPVDSVPEGNAVVFQRAHIPAVTIYSLGYITNGNDDATAPKVQPVLPGTGHTAPPTPRNFTLQTALDPAVYNQTYNLLCVYVLFLDRGLGASKRPLAETQVAAAEAPANAVPFATPPSVAAPPAAPTAPTGDTNTAARNVAALQPAPLVPMPPQPSAGTSPAATIRVNTRLVQFDVVVTDNQGRPVKDLKASDFEVLQDGKPQSVVAFETHSPIAAGQAADASSQSTSPAAATAANTFTNVPSKTPQSSWTVVLFDVLNTSAADQAYARSQLLQLLRSLPKGQPVALFVLTRQLEMVQGFTQDPEDLVRRTELLQPSKSQDLTTMGERERDTSRIVSTAQQAAPTSGMAANASFNSDSIAFSQASRILQNYNDHEAFRSTDRALFTLAAMKGMARAVSGYPGRKNLIWLSGSFPVDIEPNPATMDPFRNVRSFDEEIRETSSLLATSRVAVYPVDVRGLQSKGIDITMSASETQFMNDVAPNNTNGVIAPSTSSLGNTLSAETTSLVNDRVTMKNIAEQTGGEAFVNTNDLKRVINRSLEDGSTYYTLAYTPPKEDQGGYHKVLVQVPNKNWKLAYRRGYYSIPPVTSSSAVGTAALRTALQPGMPPSTSMLLTASLELPDAKRQEVKVNLVINSSGVDFTDVPDNKKRAQIDCMVIAFDSSGKEVAHASDTLDATLPANAYAAVMAYGLPAHQLIALTPGRYNLRIGVMDRTTQQIGTVDAPLEVPALSVAQR